MSLSLPFVIVRMYAAYGNEGGMLMQHLDSVIDERPVRPVAAEPPPAG